MKKTFCDICKKEIKASGKPISFRVDLWEGENEKIVTARAVGSFHIGEKEIDVCQECVTKLCKEALKKEADSE